LILTDQSFRIKLIFKFIWAMFQKLMLSFFKIIKRS